MGSPSHLAAVPHAAAASAGSAGSPSGPLPNGVLAAIAAATSPLLTRIERLEIDLARALDMLDAHARTVDDERDLASRAALRMSAAAKGTRLGRPPGSRGSAAHPSAGARDDEPIAQTGTAVFPDLRNADDVQAISDCILESVTLYAMQASEKGQASTLVSLLDLEAHARAYQADMGRGWPFGSTRHFGRRLGMAREELLAQGIRLMPMRSTKGKRFWKIETLAPDGHPVVMQPPAAPAAPDADTGETASATGETEHAPA